MKLPFSDAAMVRDGLLHDLPLRNVQNQCIVGHAKGGFQFSLQLGRLQSAVRKKPASRVAG
jgi:hypothetical protein